MNHPSQRDELFRRALKRSVVLHAVVVFALLIGPLVLGLFHRKKPEDQITFVDLAALAPLPAPVLKQPEPAPEPEPEPEPPPAPVIPEKSQKDVIKKPEPPKTNQVTKSTIKISTNKVKRAASAPVQQRRPTMTAAEIRQLLASGMPVGGSSSGGQASEMSIYYALVRAAMYDAWVQPDGLANAGITAQVTIRVQRDGAITQRNMTRRSGNSTMDESVMRAVNAVSRLKPLPAGVVGFYKDITIDFELTGLP